ncbi:19806_t:CDS:1, partial [Dentiscutata erythropus]
ANHKERVVVYTSHFLTPAESNYAITKKECLAVVWVVSYFRSYLHRSHFTLYTDYSALKSLFSHRLPQNRLAGGS